MAEPESKVVEEVKEEEEHEEGVDEAEGEQVSVGEIAKVMQNPQLLSAIQDKLSNMVGTPSGYVQSLPKVVKRRIKAMKKLQFDIVNVESDFYKEVHTLECKYAAKYASMFAKRKEILLGTVEPTDEEADWPSDEEDKDDDLPDLKQKAVLEDKTDEEKKENEDKDKEDDDVKGIPHFWLTVFKNVDMLSEMVQDHDEPILEHLQDIQVKFWESDPVGFTLEFYFSPNEYFKETVLTKQYTMRFEPDPTDPLSYEGPEIIKCKGCTITWNTGKNITVRVVKKKQKHKGRGTTRTVTKTIQNDSFFNFFNPPTVPEGEEGDMDEDLEALLAADFEIGHFIRERIIPKAVLYFTGEALDHEEFEEENEEEHDADEDYNEDDDPDFNPQGEKPAECKQQ
ncbi:nucleosome assembly protein 1-like 1-A isoform X2 [Gigantopelta aegis]|uniref:nucleosome assembly protein 1-like 1-A isoform X2 n=1 Tax=Gigantopelta aegis TaxID=1735272 RepID=UPI001B887F74|nr:nucleosome assembly protein 1-like 1-A isoform X2 [Gigantopelta aegis]